MTEGGPLCIGAAPPFSTVFHTGSCSFAISPSEVSMHPETVRMSSVPSRPDSNILLLALEATGDGIWYWDVGSDETFFSPSYYRMLGYEPNAFPMTGQSWLNRIHPEDRHRVLEENTRCINNPEKTLQVEYRMLKKDGGYAWILCRGRCIDSDETGKAVNVIGTTTNISDRKQMEHELLESIETVRTVIEESPFSLVVTDRETNRILHVNRRYLQMIGRRREDVVGTICGVFSHVPESVRNRLTYLLDRNGSFDDEEISLAGKDGDVRSFSVSARIISLAGRNACLAAFQDITRLKETEATLALSEERLRLALNGSKSAVWDWNLKDDTTYFSPQWYTMLGYAPGPVGSDLKAWSSLTHPDDVKRTLEKARKTIQYGNSYEAEFRMRAADGSWKWILGRATVSARDQDGQATRLSGTNTDITSIKQLEMELRDAQSFLKTLLNTIPSRVFWKDTESRYLGGNSKFLRDTRLPSEAHLIGKTDHDLPWSGKADAFLMEDRMILDSGKPVLNQEGEFLSESGVSSFYLVNKVPIYDNAGNIRGLLGTYENITERKKMDDAIRAIAQSTFLSSSEPFFSGLCRHLAEATGADTVIVAELGGPARTQCSPLAQWSSTGAVSASMSSLTDGTGNCVHEPTHPCPLKNALGVVNQQGFVCTPIADSHGEILGFLAAFRQKPFRNEKNVQALLRIFSARAGGELVRMRAEECLTRSEKKFSDVFRLAQTVITISELETGRFLDVNETFSKLTGYGRDEVIGKTSHELGIWSRPEDRSALVAAIRQKGQVNNFQVAMGTKSGKAISVLLSATLIEQGGRNCLLTSAIDITEHLEREKQLRESQEKFATAFRMSPDFIAITDLETGEFLEANEGFQKILGCSAETIRGRTVFELNFWHDFDDRRRFVREVLEKGECLNFPTKFRNASGTPIDALISSRAITFEDKKCMLSIVHDISEQKKLQEQLQHSQKMEAIGTLAGGIAHDFNNMLTGIIGHAQLALGKAGGDSAVAQNLNTILSLSNKAGQLNHSLLAFSRKQVLNRETICLSVIVRKSESFLRQLIGEDIVFSVRVLSDAAVFADSLQIEQVIMNLVINARDAMPHGGKLSITVRIEDIDRAVADRYQLEKTGEYACLIVSDTGMGIGPEVIEHIFEPFFTTKEVGKGTGLGLSMAYGNIRQHGGFITVYSEIGIGTEFRIYLPVVGDRVHTETGNDERNPASGGNETILVAEDDITVRNLNRDILELAGYTVFEARDGEEAIQVYREHQKDISLVLLDVIMPNKNGRQAGDAIRRINPAAKILFMSGYTDEYIRERTDLGSDAELILKPVSPDRLLRKVRETLDRASNRYRTP